MAFAKFLHTSKVLPPNFVSAILSTNTYQGAKTCLYFVKSKPQKCSLHYDKPMKFKTFHVYGS